VFCADATLCLERKFLKQVVPRKKTKMKTRSFAVSIFALLLFALASFAQAPTSPTGGLGDQSVRVVDSPGAPQPFQYFPSYASVRQPYRVVVTEGMPGFFWGPAPTITFATDDADLCTKYDSHHEKRISGKNTSGVTPDGPWVSRIDAFRKVLRAVRFLCRDLGLTIVALGPTLILMVELVKQVSRHVVS
jgi:hypothetical protein